MHVALRSASRFPLRLAALALLVSVVAPLHGRLHAQDVAPSLAQPSVVTADTTIAPRDSAPAPVVAVAPAVAPAGAPLNGLRAGVHTRETARGVAVVAADKAHLGQAKAMMVVGAAALITGAIIEGDAGKIIMVGGAVIGLYGLYQYLQ